MINPTPEIILLLFNVGDSLSMVAIQVFIYSTSCLLTTNAHGYDESVCASETAAEAGLEAEQTIRTQKLAATYLLCYRLVTYLPAIIVMLLCGAWSDRVGRKLPIVLSKVGIIMGGLCFLTATILTPVHAIQLVLTGGAVCGMSGHVAVVHMGIQSYVAEITTERTKVHRMYILLTMNFLGRLLGNVLVGVLLQFTNFAVIFCVYVGVTSLSLIASIALLKEETPVDFDVDVNRPTETKQSPSNSEDTLAIANIPRARSLAEWKDFFSNPRCNKGKIYMAFYLALGASLALCRGGQWDLFALFVKRQPLLWNGSLYAYGMAAYFTSEGICGILIMPLLSRIIGMHDVIILIQGLASLTAAYVLFGFSVHSWMVFLSLVVLGNGISALTALRGLLSKLVRQDEINRAFSLLMAVETVFTMIGALVFNGIYLSSLNMLPGFTFFLLAGVCFIFMLGVVAVSPDVMSRWRHGRGSSLSQDIKPFTRYGTEQDPPVIAVISDNEDDHDGDTNESEIVGVQNGGNMQSLCKETNNVK